MKTIELRSITLRNWRGEKERTTTMNAGPTTTISGGNGLGKSRHKDAFLWLLFGKDSQNRQNYEVRSYDRAHRVLHKVECSVEATLTVNGTPLTIKREWRENWVKPKGEPEEVFKGNKAYFWWNGVPVLEKEFTKRVNDELVDETLFKMITNPTYFVTMKWEEQRAELMRMAGEKSLTTLAEGNADFMALLDRLNGKSLADYRKEVAARKKLLKDELTKIPARIDEVQRQTPEAKDWNELEMEQGQLADRLRSVEIQLRHRDERTAAQIDKLTEIKKQAREQQAKQAELIAEARKRAQQEADRKNERRAELEAKLKQLHTRKSQDTIDSKREAKRIEYLQKEWGSANNALKELRNDWYAINHDEYDEKGDVCPCCGQLLPEDKRMEAREKFKAVKEQRLRDNNEKGKKLAARSKSLNEELNTLLASAETRKAAMETTDKAITQLTKELMDTPIAKPRSVSTDNMAEYQEAQKKIDQLLHEKLELEKSTDKEGDAKVAAKLNADKAEIAKRDREITLLLATRKQIEQCEARKAELQERGRDLAQQIADIEKDEYVASQLSKAKIEDCERRINSMFDEVQWKMFTYTQDGSAVETCVPIVGGVPYGAANTASQMAAGLDIISTLCQYHDVCAPIFIDNAECTTTPLTPHVGGSKDSFGPQMIYLRVEEGELRVR